MEHSCFVPFLRTVMMNRGNSSSSKSRTTPSPWEWIEMVASYSRIALRWSESLRPMEMRSLKSSSWRSWIRLSAFLSTQAPNQWCQTTHLWSSMSLTNKMSSSMTCWPTSLVTMLSRLCIKSLTKTREKSFYKISNRQWKRCTASKRPLWSIFWSKLTKSLESLRKKSKSSPLTIQWALLPRDRSLSSEGPTAAIDKFW